MQIVETYEVAVLLCLITMICWGSWANTQKLAGKNWRFELFYWDYVIGIVLLSLGFAFTLGSFGDEGRGFMEDLAQADARNVGVAALGGVIFNLANILLVAAISIAGMAVAFPVGIGIALILGVLVNYYASPSGDATTLFIGVGLVAVAIILDAVAYKRISTGKKKVGSKGIVLSIIAGVLMAYFYRFVASSMALDFANPQAGMLTPYTAMVAFAAGILLSNFVFNTIFMKRPVEGDPVTYKEYFSADFKTHLTGILGGVVWCVGMSLSIISAGKAGFAISYGLGQGATLVAAMWGVFIWKEFKGADPDKGVGKLIGTMFALFLGGIGCVIYAGL